MKTFLLTIFFLLLGTTLASAATYPVKELGNCRDARECHLYCEVPANKPACWAYNQSQVLGDATPSATPVFPIAELGGCTDKVACKLYCSVAEHHVACEEFARSHSLGKLPPAAALIAKAKTELGCDSITSCKAACDLEGNKGKCRVFTLKFASEKVQARVLLAETLLQALEKAFGCTSKQTCMQYCQLPANRSSCADIFRSFAPGVKNATGSGELLERERQKLKADCTTAEECRAWCVAHPLLCPTLNRPIKSESTSATTRPSPTKATEPAGESGTGL